LTTDDREDYDAASLVSKEELAQDDAEELVEPADTKSTGYFLPLQPTWASEASSITCAHCLFTILSFHLLKCVSVSFAKTKLSNCSFRPNLGVKSI